MKILIRRNFKKMEVLVENLNLDINQYLYIIKKPLLVQSYLAVFYEFYPLFCDCYS